MADPKSPPVPAPIPSSPDEPTPRHYSQARAQRRVRPLYDPYEIARHYLDQMEAGGRLHGTMRRTDAPDPPG